MTRTGTVVLPKKQGGARTELEKAIEAEIVTESPNVRWDDVIGLESAKTALEEAVILPTLRADLFQGLRAPARGILLYGPPGNGKTMLAKAVATRASCTFFAISASSLTSKWLGEGEKLVRALFSLARERQPSLIFMDEIDSLLSARSSSEHDASRRLKTEFLVQFDGVASGEDRMILLAATNRPEDLDEAVRRRLVKRIYVPLPDVNARLHLIGHLLQQVKHSLSANEKMGVAKATTNYSGSDLKALCQEAAMMPLRELGSKLQDVRAEKVRPVRASDFATALKVIRPSVSTKQLQHYVDWTRDFGTAA